MYLCLKPLLLILVSVLVSPQVISYSLPDYSKGVNLQDDALPYPVKLAASVNRLVGLLARQQRNNPEPSMWAYTLPRDHHGSLSRQDEYESEGTMAPNQILMKREGPPLSIVNALDVLRQQLMLDMARQKMRENQSRIQANDEYLKKIGKRSVSYKSNLRSPNGSRLHRSSLREKEILQEAHV